MKQLEVELQEFMGSDRSIAESAWTSSLTRIGKQKRSDEDVAKVIKFLAEEKHATPFESVILRFWIRMPIFIDRQHMTHRIATHNGLSGRYRTLPSDFFELPNDVVDIITKMDGSKSLFWKSKYTDLCTAAHNFYKEVLSDLKASEKARLITNSEYKRVRETIRGVTPVATMTERITIVNLRSFANYQKLRNSIHAQPEIRYIAERMLEEVKKQNVCPSAVEWLEANNWSI